MHAQEIQDAHGERIFVSLFTKGLREILKFSGVIMSYIQNVNDFFLQFQILLISEITTYQTFRGTEELSQGTKDLHQYLLAQAELVFQQPKI